MRTGHYLDPAARERYRRAYAAAVAALPAHTTDDVDTPFGQVRVLRIAGRGASTTAPWVLLPGTGAPGASWSALVPELAEYHDVVLVDALGGPGGSRQEVPLRRFDDQIAWLDAMLTGLGLPDVNLAGVSMGGRVALGLACRGHPGLRSLALLDPVLTFDRIPPRALAASPGRLPGAPAWLRRRFLHTAGGDPADGGNQEATLFAAGLESYAPAAPVPPLASGAELANVSVPALVVLGGRSALLRAERARRRALAHLPDAHVTIWPDATHAVVGADPPVLARELAAHAERSLTATSR